MARRQTNRTRHIAMPLLAGAMMLAMAPVAAPASATGPAPAAPAPAALQAAASLYEAENATIFEGQVNSDHPGFTGTGFVNYDNVVGSYVEFAVTAPAAGTFTLTFRYANGTSTNRPVDVAVNGSVKVPNLAFGPTGTWDTWTTQTATVDLAAGANTVRATATTSNGGPNLDSMSVEPRVSSLLEAEDATIFEGQVNSDHPGFTGTGFVNYDNVVGSYVEFAVTAPAAGTFTLTFRYANGTSTNRPVDVAVNGSVKVPNLAFGPTGTWDTWTTQTATVDLAAGTNTIRATATTSGGGPNLDSMNVASGGGGGTDWSTAVVNSTTTRYTPGTIGGWSYPIALYLYGQYLVYQRTHNPAYLQYIRNWADRFVASDGSISNSFNSLDSMEPGNILLILYRETGQAKYRIAAQKIRDRLKTYPRTTDGGFWHATSREHQLWADGTFMVVPFLVRYGQIVGETAYTQDEAAKQLIVYGSHLQTSLGILKHAYDEARAQSWADPVTGVSPEYWCRAIGWYGMAEIETLEALPATHPQRAKLLMILQNLVAGYARFQDPATGRWFQVVDKGSRSDNWTETSCSAMYTFVISRAVQRGWVDPGYATVASKGYQGVLAKVSVGSDGLTNITDICIGTNVGDYSYYIGRTRATNDFHGLGAFLIMNEQLQWSGG
jgi:unsaturated rhamnogalacturonyl hydrolase